jgi:hypothetical protein
MTSPENNGLLEGSIPSEIGLLTGLRRLYLGRLQEKDSVFSTLDLHPPISVFLLYLCSLLCFFPSVQNIRSACLGGNAFIGSIPLELTQMTTLRFLMLGMLL